jgi:hypothetical protein
MAENNTLNVPSNEEGLLKGVSLPPNLSLFRRVLLLWNGAMGVKQRKLLKFSGGGGWRSSVATDSVFYGAATEMDRWRTCITKRGIYIRERARLSLLAASSCIRLD